MVRGAERNVAAVSFKEVVPFSAGAMLLNRCFLGR